MMRNTALVALFSLITIFSACTRASSPNPPSGPGGEDSARPFTSENSTETDEADYPFQEPASVNQEAWDTYVQVFAETFHTSSLSAAELDRYEIGWYSFWRIYEDQRIAIDEAGRCIIPQSDLVEYINAHFGIEAFTFPDQDFPVYEPDREGYEFYPIGEGSLAEPAILSFQQQGNSVVYTVLVTKRDMTSAIVSEDILTYVFEAVDYGSAKVLQIMRIQ